MDDIIKLRRYFHSIPEPAWMEVVTTIKIIEFLRTLNCTVYYGKKIHSTMVDKPSPEILEKYVKSLKLKDLMFDTKEIQEGYTGCIAVFDTLKSGPTTAIRADIDALPIHESEKESHLPNLEDFNSKTTYCMHACGHDAHISITLKAAEYISDNLESLKGKFIIIFQPAEEGVRGGLSLINSPFTENINYFFSSHIGMGLESGLIGTFTKDFLGTKKFDVKFLGHASHAGMAPEFGRNAILGASALTLGLHTLPQYGHGSARVNVGLINGGIGRNVVAPEAEVKMEIRSDKNDILEDLDSHVKHMAKGVAEQYGLSYKVTLAGAAQIFEKYNPYFKREINDFLTKKGYKIIPSPSLNASEDVTCYLNKITNYGGKVAHFIIGSDLKADHHNEEFDFDENSLHLGLNLYKDLIDHLNS